MTNLKKQPNKPSKDKEGKRKYKFTPEYRGYVNIPINASDYPSIKELADGDISLLVKELVDAGYKLVIEQVPSFSVSCTAMGVNTKDGDNDGIGVGSEAGEITGAIATCYYKVAVKANGLLWTYLNASNDDAEALYK